MVNMKGKHSMYIDEMITIKKTVSDSIDKRRYKEIRNRWIELKESEVDESELIKFLKSLTEQEFNVFYENFGHNPLKPKVKEWRNS